MAVRLVLASVVIVCGVLVAGAAAAVPTPPYTRAATQSCLAKLPQTVVGLPPATPPVRPTLFVYALAHDDIAAGLGLRARAHQQLGAWSGDRNYSGIILSFFKSVADARASLKPATSLYGGLRIRNVVATWDAAAPSRTVRNTVYGCLRSSGSAAPRRPGPRASFATFAGRWGGHDRGLPITPRGRGREFGNASCCERVYQLGFQILSVHGTVTQATAVYRVTSFRRYESGVRRLRVGAIGKLLLRNGIVTNSLTRDFFCSDPAWGATDACGA